MLRVESTNEVAQTSGLAPPTELTRSRLHDGTSSGGLPSGVAGHPQPAEVHSLGIAKGQLRPELLVVSAGSDGCAEDGSPLALRLWNGLAPGPWSPGPI